MSEFKVGDTVMIKRSGCVGKIVYQNPDGILSEVKLDKDDGTGWPRYYKDSDMTMHDRKKTGA